MDFKALDLKVIIRYDILGRHSAKVSHLWEYGGGICMHYAAFPFSFVSRLALNERYYITRTKCKIIRVQF